MTNKSEVHWSKDFVEHLRTVHFALIVVASALIITGTNTDSTRMLVALTQIQQIAKFERQWSTIPARLYEQAMLDSKLDPNWYSGLAIVLPPAVYNGREIDVSMDVPKSVVLEPRRWKFGGAILPTELTNLSEFKDFWNMLNKGITVVLPRAPDNSSACAEIVRIVHPDGSTDLIDPILRFDGPTGPQECVVGAGMMAAIGGPQFDLKYQLNSNASNEDIVKYTSIELW